MKLKTQDPISRWLCLTDRGLRGITAGCGATVLLVGCVMFTSNDDFGVSWSDKQLSHLTRVWGPPSAQDTKADGSVEVRYDMERARCTYWFTANPEGRIVGYRYRVGDWGTCKPV